MSMSYSEGRNSLRDAKAKKFIKKKIPQSWKKLDLYFNKSPNHLDLVLAYINFNF